jgi:hypothetical protein
MSKLDSLVMTAVDALSFGERVVMLSATDDGCRTAWKLARLRLCQLGIPHTWGRAGYRWVEAGGGRLEFLTTAELRPTPLFDAAGVDVAVMRLNEERRTWGLAGFDEIVWAPAWEQWEAIKELIRDPRAPKPRDGDPPVSSG